MLQPEKLILNNAYIAGSKDNDKQAKDIAIDVDGKISRIGINLTAEDHIQRIDLCGRLVTPAFVDMHQHLDKSFTIDDAPNPTGTLQGAADAFRNYANVLSKESIKSRATIAIDRCLALGTVAIRSHTNVDYEMQLRGVESLADIKKHYKHRMYLDIVAFISSSAARGDIKSAQNLLDSAIAAGANTVGGAPNISSDPKGLTDMLLSVAASNGLYVDLHIDETLDPSSRMLEYLAEQTIKHGLEGKVVAGHCSSLFAMDQTMAKQIISKVKDAGIGIVTLPAANLFLQGRESNKLPARGLTRVNELLEHKVKVATASDNIQDAFVPIGTGDMLENARWTILAAHLLKDATNVAFDMISSTPAELINFDKGLIAEGHWANFVITPAKSLADLVRSGGSQRTVFYHGNCVSGEEFIKSKPITERDKCL